MNTSTNFRSTLIALHALDPFGSKVGGIETHVRQVIRYRPADLRVILIGVDDSGQRKLGELVEIQDEAGSYWFMPIMHCHTVAVNSAAKRLLQSVTLNFFKNVLRYLPRIRALAREMPATLDIQRYEYSWLCQLIGVPYVLTTHGDMRPDQPMDSLLSKYPYLHRFNEGHAVRHAAHVYSVNKEQTERIRKEIKGAAGKTEFMTVSVDDRLFQPTPYLQLDGPVQIAFVGRLDHFKRPGMMFDVIRRVDELAPAGARFHYVGAADPTDFPEFAAIAGITTRHGFKNSAQIAELWRGWHLGLVTSTFEGMPVYVLEALCSGRPVCSIHLPQMHLVIRDDVSGTVLPGNNDSAELAQALANELLRYWSRIRTGELEPQAVSERVVPYKASRQMGVLYARHASLVRSA
ncbi:glycosyltransferase family 4 protein [Uliginosibacterium aquaticum]|uniref:Glycosyltransferase n=1 Tax=Uliginosibacterium aquaticum TaxID=2731212 RepID=A0ABX2IC21_9RHOO|nr:glycosyltransferase [Uliginosibacterium aquaticum]NSL54034.1 glycosyltransferase [Uliginosibacterium aquaticum]